MLGARRLGSLTICGVLALGAAACIDDDADEPVEEIDTDADAGDDAATSTAEVDDEQAVVDAYEAMWEAAIASGDPPNPDAPELAETMTGDALTNMRNFLATNEAEGVAIRGTYEFDARATSVEAETATVEDCGLDRSERVVMATGEVVEPYDDERDGIVAELVREGGTWKVATVRDDPAVCS